MSTFWLLCAAVAAGLVAGRISGRAAARRGGGTLSVEELLIVDGMGAVRALIGVGTDGDPVIALCDRRGGTRVAISLTKGRPSIALYDSFGKPRMAAGLDRGQPTVAVFHRDGEARFQASMDQEGNMRMVRVGEEEELARREP